MDIKTAFDKIVEVTKMAPLDVAIWFIILALFVWLYKEFKAQYQRNKDLKIAKVDRFMSMISNSLSIAYHYKTDQNKAPEYFASVFNCFPLMNSDEIKEIKKTLDDSSLPEQEKIEQISKTLHYQLIYLSGENRDFKSVNSGLEGLDYVLNKLKDIVFPIGQAFFTLLAVLFLFTILSIGENMFLKFLRLTAVLLFPVFFVGFIDLHLKKKLKKYSIIPMILIFICLLLLILQINYFIVISSLVCLIVFLFVLYKFGLKF